MPIRDATCHTQYRIRHVRDPPLNDSCDQRCLRQLVVSRKTEIVQGTPHRPKSIFKQNQALLAPVGAAKIQLFRSGTFTFLDKVPKKEWHRPEIVKPFVGTSVLVNHRLAMSQREQASNRNAFLAIRIVSLSPINFARFLNHANGCGNRLWRFLVRTSKR
jgi:hypothetical protein